MTIQLEGGNYYTAAAAAKELGVSERQVRTFISEGRLPTVNVNGRVLIHENELMSFKETYKKWEKPR